MTVKYRGSMVTEALWTIACWGDSQEGQDNGPGSLSKTHFPYLFRHTLSQVLCSHSSSNPNNYTLREPMIILILQSKNLKHRKRLETLRNYSRSHHPWGLNPRAQTLESACLLLNHIVSQLIASLYHLRG